STVRARLRLSFLSFVFLSARRYAVARTIWAPWRGLSLSANAPAAMTIVATSTTTQIIRSIIRIARLKGEDPLGILHIGQSVRLGVRLREFHKKEAPRGFVAWYVRRLPCP